MRKQKQEKELKKVTYYPKINKESNLRFKVNPKKYSTIERLYTQDLIKRKEKKQILTKIYTPTFKPQIYTNKNVFNKNNQRNLRTEIREEENNNYIFDNSEDTDDKFNEEKNTNILDDKKVENELRNLLFKNKRGSIKRNKSVEKRKKIKFSLD
jgi:spore germination protein YaaH